MKKFILVALAFSFLAVTSHAQTTPAGDVAVDYSYLRAEGVNLNGFNVDASYNANPWFGVVGDLGVYHGSSFGVGVSAETYTFGPRFSVRRSDKFVPFAQALFGGSHVSASFGNFSGSTNPFDFGFGGGADISIGGSGRVGFRPELDYVGLRSNGQTANGVRLSLGIVFHLGER